MKAFEEWNDGKFKEASCCKCCNITCDQCEALRQDGWWAALAWVKEQLEDAGEFQWNSLPEIIEQELEDK
jgi:hypothetical protein